MKIKKLIKPSRLIFLILLLASNTLAWFIYATKVDNNVSVHVKAWNIVLEAGDTAITNTINLDIDSIYPGMEDYEYQIVAHNRSEVSANLSYQILEARILNETYISVEGREALGEPAVATDLTSAQLSDKLLNDYPFSISIDMSDDYMELEEGEETYTISVIWPYESNQDELDTQWGINAATYKESNPTNSSIALKVKILITQSTS